MGSCKRNLYLAVPLAFAAQLAFGQAGGLPAETSAREAADTQLQNSINAEAAARTAADTGLRNSINDETAARALGEARLQGNIGAEAAARAAGDAVLRGSVESEAGARAAADGQLQTQIDQLRNNGGGSGGGTANVDCTTGGSVAQALAAGANQINIRGTCTESVNVDRDGVTLQGEAGATIRGPDVDVNTINVRGNRVTIDGLTVTGGRNGITGLGAANLTVRNCNAQSTGRTGISYVNGSSGTVDGCIVQSNARDGIAVDGAQATIVNSTVTNNSRNGVLLANGATGRIGLTDRLTGAGNIITQNGATGVTVAQGSTGTIAMNSITDNGTNPTFPRSGVSVSQSAASITGGNTISRNAGQGVFAGTGSSVVLGDLGVGLPTTVNTISANGNPASPGGVFVFLGSTMVVRDAVIEQNNGPGLAYSMRSQGQIFSSTIRNNVDVPTTNGFINTGDGIRLTLGSVLLPATPTSTISGNAGFGLQCTDGESSAVNTFAPFLTFTGNLRGDVPNCSGF
jgi:hypothetical protein